MVLAYGSYAVYRLAYKSFDESEALPLWSGSVIVLDFFTRTKNSLLDLTLGTIFTLVGHS